MKKSDLTCPVCHAGYRRIELTSRPGASGEYRCLLCDEVLETFDGSTDVAIRLTVQPEKTFAIQVALATASFRGGGRPIFNFKSPREMVLRCLVLWNPGAMLFGAQMWRGFCNQMFQNLLFHKAF